MALTRVEIDALMKGIAPVIKEHVNKLRDQMAKATGEAIGKLLNEEVGPIEKRIAALEANSVKYLGVWDVGKTYGPNCLVTDHGSVWISRATTTDRPGTNYDAWQLAAKSKDIAR